MTTRSAVIKIGGAALDERELLERLAEELAAVRAIQLVLVHGGGKEITRYLHLLGKSSTFSAGLRVTDAASLEVVEMVLSGLVNKRIVTALVKRGIQALGISGKDLGLFEAKKLVHGGQDLGFVGEIVYVNTEFLQLCFENHIIPVISPVSLGKDGKSYNVNADEAACAVAKAIVAQALIFITDVDGIQTATGKVNKILSSEAEKLIVKGEIEGGMIPKVQGAITALKGGVSQVHIGALQDPGCLLKALTEGKIFGSLIKGDDIDL